MTYTYKSFHSIEELVNYANTFNQTIITVIGTADGMITAILEEK